MLAVTTVIAVTTKTTVLAVTAVTGTMMQVDHEEVKRCGFRRRQGERVECITREWPSRAVK